MIRVIWSSDNKIVDQYANKIINNFDTTDIVRVDGDFEEVISVKQHFISGSIFDESSRRVVVYKNANFLTAPSKLKKFEKNELDKIAEVISDDEELLVVFTVCADKISSEKWLKSWLAKVNVTHGKVPEKKDLEAFVQKYFNKKNSSISESALKKLIDKTNSSFSLVVNESKKLTALNEPITEEIVNLLVNDYKKKNLFKLPSLIVKGEEKKSADELNELLADGTNINQIVAILISQLGYYKKVKFYMNKYNNDYNMVTSSIGGSPYRAKIAIDELRNVEIEDITKLIDNTSKFLVELRKGRKIDLIEWIYK